MKRRIPFVHVVFRTNGAHDLLDDEHAAWLWDGLQRSFPDSIANVLMPNHGHLLTRRAPNIRRRLGSILGRFTTRFRDERQGWLRVPPPAPIQDTGKLIRAVKYVYMNPCRPGLTGDPLRWRWSTYRDVMGATIDPWVTERSLRVAIGWDAPRFRERLHRYVSSDSSTLVRGTPPPSRLATEHPPLEAIRAGVAAALRRDASARLGRKACGLFVAAAQAYGWRSTDRIAAVAGCSPRTVRRMVERGLCIDDDALAAIATCITDSRLHR